MRKILLLSLSCFVLNGCMSYAPREDASSRSGLRAPEQSSFRPEYTPPANMPQSVTQPYQMAQQYAQPAAPAPAPTSAPAQVVPQQPFVQTIVIPQYAPQPVMMPTAQPAAAAPAQVVNSTPQAPMPMSYSVPVSGSPDVPVNAQVSMPTQTMTVPSMMTPQVPSSALTDPTGGIPKPVVKSVNDKPVRSISVASDVPNVVIPDEPVFPAWAAADYKMPTTQTIHTGEPIRLGQLIQPGQSVQVQQKSAGLILLKHPNRSEIVQCDSLDSLCISSYQQQGYTQLAAGAQAGMTGGYPKTETKPAETVNIPRW